MRKPNFFLVGAPKCGTTALSEYLREHPCVFMTTPKEPHYFAVDYPRVRYVTEPVEYERLYSKAGAQHLAVGEASPGYLGSREAIGLIHAYNPEARIIVTLRNPVDLLPSYHAQLLFSLYEDEADLETAWRLQSERKQGRHIPPHCREPEVLQYREAMALGDQLRRLLDVFPREQVLVVFYDDFCVQPRATYQQVLAFLGVPDDGRENFPVVNAKKKSRWRWMNVILHSPPAWMLLWMKRLSGTVLHGMLVSMHGILKRVNSAQLGRAELPREFRAELVEVFAPQIDLLERLTGRSLKHWRSSGTH